MLVDVVIGRGSDQTLLPHRSSLRRGDERLRIHPIGIGKSKIASGARFCVPGSAETLPRASVGFAVALFRSGKRTSAPEDQRERHG